MRGYVKNVKSSFGMKYSVIIPLFNKAPYIKRALESVIDQTFRDFEIVVIDDGSSDSSYFEAQRVLEGSGVYYKLKHQENAGVSTTRNNGVAFSSGDYLCFLDADDWWATTFLEKMDELIHTYPDAGIYGMNYYIEKNGKDRIAVHYAKTGYINYCQSYRKMQMPLWTGAVCIPRHIFSETGGFKPFLRLGEDFDLWIRIALKYKVAFYDEPLAFYCQDSDPTWRLVGRLHDPKEHMLWNLDYLSKEEETNPDYKRLIDELRTYSLLPYYLSRNYREAAKGELNKVDWEKQPKRTRCMYRQPIWVLKGNVLVRRLGSSIKRWLSEF